MLAILAGHFETLFSVLEYKYTKQFFLKKKVLLKTNREQQKCQMHEMDL